VFAGIDGLTMFCEIRGASEPVKVPPVLLRGDLRDLNLIRADHRRSALVTAP
jgi:hypothetical protein